MNANMDPDQKAITGGLDIDRPNVLQILALMRVLNEYAMRAIEEKSIDVLMEFLYNHLGMTLQKIDDSKRACRMGCSFCCNNWVTATIPEVLYALKAIKDEQRELVQANAASMEQLTAGKSLEERHAMITPCPLLEHSACGVYENRPIVCRTAVSNDAAICERVYFDDSGEEIPGTFHHYGIKGIYGLALAGALKKARLAPFYYEYNSALNAALNANGTEADWLSGKDVFLGIAHDPQGEMFSSPWNQKIFDDAFS